MLYFFQVFEKALDEPKYSSMYAQLCKRLAENAPNFDPPDKPCTFRRLLLNKCRDEFENRAQLCSQMERKAAAMASANGGPGGAGDTDIEDAR